MKRNVRKVLGGSLIFMIIILGVYLTLKPQPVPLTGVALKTAELTVAEQGTVTGSRMVRVYPLVQGEILEILVEEGQQVKAGDVICVIDSRPTLEKIKQTEQTIESYRSQMAAESNTNTEQQTLQLILIEQGEKDLQQARLDLSRALVLYQEGHISLAEYETAGQKVSECQSALDVNRQELKILSESILDSDTRSYYQSLIAIETSNLLVLNRELEQCSVKAIADGTITALPVKESNVTGSDPVAELAVTDRLYIETYVSTGDIGAIVPGGPVRLILERREGDVTLEGTVSRISENASLTVSALGLEEKRIKIEIIPDLSEYTGNLGIGYEVEVQFLLYREEEQLTVPKTALFKQNGEDMVWLVQSGRLKAVAVIKGMELRTETVVLSGLEAGNYVVTDANNESLREGLRVAGE